MTLTRSAWRDCAYEWLQLLAPGEYILAGELFDEVRSLIPLHLAMRQAVRQTKGRKDVPLDQAQWMLFTQGMRTGKGIAIDRQPFRGQRGWNYRDRIRLATAKGMKCPDCHTESMLQRRGVYGNARCFTPLYYCERCEHPVRVNVSEVGEAAPVLAGVGASTPPRGGEPSPPPRVKPVKKPVRVKKPIKRPVKTPPVPVPVPLRPEFTEIPIEPAAKPVPPVPVMTLRLPGVVEPPPPPLLKPPPKEDPIPRRIMARMIRSLLRKQHVTTVSAIERQLEREHDNANAVLAKHGYTAHQQMIDLINSNKLLQTIYNAMGTIG